MRGLRAVEQHQRPVWPLVGHVGQAPVPPRDQASRQGAGQVRELVLLLNQTVDLVVLHGRELLLEEAAALQNHGVLQLRKDAALVPKEARRHLVQEPLQVPCDGPARGGRPVLPAGQGLRNEGHKRDDALVAGAVHEAH